MKRFFAVLTALALIVALTVPAAAQDSFAVVGGNNATRVSEVNGSEALKKSFVKLPRGSEVSLQKVSDVGSNTMSEEDPSQSEVPVMVVMTTQNAGDMARSGKLLLDDVRYSGRSDFNTSFRCIPQDGNKLNIWVVNYGSQDIYVNVNWSNYFGLLHEEYQAFRIPPGEGSGGTYAYESGKGMDGTWSINETTISGGIMDIQVSARQYQINQ